MKEGAGDDRHTRSSPQAAKAARPRPVRRPDVLERSVSVCVRGNEQDEQAGVRTASCNYASVCHVAMYLRDSGFGFHFGNLDLEFHRSSILS